MQSTAIARAATQTPATRGACVVFGRDDCAATNAAGTVGLTVTDSAFVVVVVVSGATVSFSPMIRIVRVPMYPRHR